MRISWALSLSHCCIITSHSCPHREVAPRRHPANPAPLSSAKILTFGKFVKLPPINIKLPSMAAMAKCPKLPNHAECHQAMAALSLRLLAAFVLFSAVTWMLVPGSETGSQPTEQIASLEEADPMPTASTAMELT